MGCQWKADGVTLLRDMHNMGMVPNIEVFSILAYQSHLDFSYKLVLLKEMKKLDVLPNKAFLARVENSIKTARQRIVKVEKKLDDNAYLETDYFKEGFRQFMLYYKGWLMSMGLRHDQHPWEQYRRPSPEEQAAEDSG